MLTAQLRRRHAFLASGHATHVLLLSAADHMVAGEEKGDDSRPTATFLWTRTIYSDTIVKEMLDFNRSQFRQTSGGDDGVDLSQTSIVLFTPHEMDSSFGGDDLAIQD